MIIDCISDLHGHYPKLDGGDLLIVAGDLTATDEAHQYTEFNKWLSKQDYERKIVIAGNHDGLIEKGTPVKVFKDTISDIVSVLADGAVYLADSEHIFKGIKIWGSPWSLWFHGINPKCKAFTGSESDLEKKWKMIPSDTNILITHSPPHGLFDEVNGESVGSRTLDDEAFYLLNLELHVFGHIHEGGGNINPRTKGASDKYISVNCSYVNEHYEPVNKPIRVIL